jgi:ubiquinone/menaquinone biosynthesis C-methylase UbiE
MQRYDPVFLGDGRRAVCGGAGGQILEIAVGTGLNLPYYSPDVHLTAIDLSAAMLRVAARRAEALRRRVAFGVGDAQRLAFSDSSFDSFACTLALCGIPNERAALSEAFRVLRPGGVLQLLEHVRSPLRVVRLGQSACAPLLLRYACDDLLRDPMDHLTGIGFVIETCARSRLGTVQRVVARKP